MPKRMLHIKRHHRWWLYAIICAGISVCCVNYGLPWVGLLWAFNCGTSAVVGIQLRSDYNMQVERKAWAEHVKQLTLELQLINQEMLRRNKHSNKEKGNNHEQDE